MSTFPLRIGTPDGLLFEGDVERVVCKTAESTGASECKRIK